MLNKWNQRTGYVRVRKLVAKKPRQKSKCPVELHISHTHTNTYTHPHNQISWKTIDVLYFIIEAAWNHVCPSFKSVKHKRLRISSAVSYSPMCIVVLVLWLCWHYHRRKHENRMSPNTSEALTKLLHCCYCYQPHALSAHRIEYLSHGCLVKAHSQTFTHRAAQEVNGESSTPHVVDTGWPLKTESSLWCYRSHSLEDSLLFILMTFGVWLFKLTPLTKDVVQP